MEADLARVEAGLRGAVRTEDEYLTELASHLIVAGGKRLRPVVAMAAAGTRRAPSPTTSSRAASRSSSSTSARCTTTTSWTRPTPAAASRASTPSWGNLQAILAGDFLLSRASEIAASLGTEVAALLAHTIGRLCEGEIGQLRQAFNAARTEAEYLASIGGKTASLFSTACRIGGTRRPASTGPTSRR